MSAFFVWITVIVEPESRSWITFFTVKKIRNVVDDAKSDGMDVSDRIQWNFIG